jgi:hypothetical protein
MVLNARVFSDDVASGVEPDFTCEHGPGNFTRIV